MQDYRGLIRSFLTQKSKDMLCMPAGVLQYPYLVPGSRFYSTTLWDWDSWLTDIALRQIERDVPGSLPELDQFEKGCIQNFAAFTDETGYMPLCIEKDQAYYLQTYQPGHPINMHKPCIAQHAVFVADQCGDTDWLYPLMPKLKAFLHHYEQYFYHAKTGLFFFQDDCAVGVDNDPCIYFRPDRSTCSIFLNCLMVREMAAMAALCNKTGDPAGQKEWQAKSDRLKAAVNENCYDQLHGFYYSVDINLKPNENIHGLHQGAPRAWEGLIMRMDVWSGILALWAGIADENQAAAVVRRITDPELFWAPYGVRTLAQTEKMFSLAPTNNPSNWLGPCWGISNYLTFSALRRYGYQDQARELAEKTIWLIGQDLEKSGTLHEYYHPQTGQPIMTPDFINWNALVLNMMHAVDGDEAVQEF